MMESDERTIQHWVSLAEYDLLVAHSLFERRHFLYVGFMCHLSVEKMLKAVFVQRHHEAPPYIHKLDRLIELVGLSDTFSAEQYDLIDELTPLNIQARYPAYKDAINSLITKEKAQAVITKTGVLVAWLKDRMK